MNVYPKERMFPALYDEDLVHPECHSPVSVDEILECKNDGPKLKFKLN